ncbi:hypothetical protein [Haloferax gibbonsii]|uniref:Uncharacterized protein n=1 Tax=Haloferax gibbonsii TaxID=35746 RepID=A0A0K1IZC5_HALGI|nr:hypothetical protein [Haloferax gibbonsii]AKU09816.1 hypothetical protein ABY42_18525 [Haloferax gibbonsii]
MKLTFSKAMLGSPQVWYEGDTPRDFEYEAAMRHQFKCDECGLSILQTDLFLNAPARDPPKSAPKPAVLGFYIGTTTVKCDYCRKGANGKRVEDPAEYKDFRSQSAINEAHKGWTLNSPVDGEPLKHNSVYKQLTERAIKSIHDEVPPVLYEGTNVGPDAGFRGTFRTKVRQLKRRLDDRKIPDSLTVDPMGGPAPNPGDPRVPTNEAEDTDNSYASDEVKEDARRFDERVEKESKQNTIPDVPSTPPAQEFEEEPIRLDDDEDPFEDTTPTDIQIE